MRRLTRLVALTALVVGAVALLGACSDDDATTETAPAPRLATETVEAGEVTVKITPQRIAGNGAVFDVVFDTHSVELDLDVATNARLVVNGTTWTNATWDGAGPGGHHREGTLRFDATGDAEETAELTIDGLAEPVQATWALKGQ